MPQGGRYSEPSERSSVLTALTSRLRRDRSRDSLGVWEGPTVTVAEGARPIDDVPVTVYRPYRAGLPDMVPYLRGIWSRRAFALELSNATIRATHANTLFGQLWNVLNPMLLGLVYFMLVFIISGGGTQRPDYFAHLLTGLFAYYYIAGAMSGGATSVTSAGRIVLNTSFPRVLLPLSASLTAVRRFLPTIAVLLVVLLIGPVKLSPVLVLALPWFVFLALIASGLAMALATAQVYFRDTASFLPYVTRIWLYISPVLWFPERLPSQLQFIEYANPLYSVLGGWAQIIIEHEVPPVSTWLTAAAWSIGIFVAGALYFMSRERDFAVRL